MVENAAYTQTAVVAMVVVIQSLFGVGVLFLGTPLLLLLGFPMLEAVYLLLPISLSISVVQSLQGRRDIHWPLVKVFASVALPGTFAGSLLLKVTLVSPWLTLFVAAYLFFIALGFYFRLFPSVVSDLMRYHSLYWAITGIVHGLTNLGGPLLSTFVVTKFPDKHRSRATIAACYGFFVVVQWLTLFSKADNQAIKTGFSGRNLSPWAMVAMALLIYWFVDANVFKLWSDERFKRIFGSLILLMGFLLLIKGVLTAM